MPFTIPDKGEGANDLQSVFFQEYLDVLVAGISGIDYVSSGLAVTAQGVPDMTVAVAAGVAISNGVSFTVAGANGTITAAHATLPRLDLVVITSAGAIAVRAGTAAAAPKPAARTANDVVIAVVYVPAADTTIAANQITDLRVACNVTKVGTPVNNQIGVWTGNGTIEGDTKLTWDAVLAKLTAQGAGSSGTAMARFNAGSGNSFVQINDNGTMVLDSDASSGTNPLTVKYNGGAAVATISYNGVGTFVNLLAGTGANASLINLASGYGSIDKTATSIDVGAVYSNNLKLYTTNTANFVLLQPGGGNVGIGIVSPTSLLHTKGSFATGYVAKTADYTATISDYTIEATANTFTVTLPTAVGITGRMYFITNSGAGTITLATTSSQVFRNVTGTPTTLTIAALSGVMVQSNGADWLQVSK